MGCHDLTTADLEKLGRWNPRSETGDKPPEYMVRTAASKKAGKSKNKENAAEGNSEDMIEIKDEPIDDNVVA